MAEAPPVAYQNPIEGSRRRSAIGCILTIFVLIAIVSAFAYLGSSSLHGTAGGPGGGSSSSDNATLNLDANSRGAPAAFVGDSASEVVYVTNNDSDIEDLVVLYADGGDNWLDHHALTNSGACTVNKSLKAFQCGPLKKGASMTISIEATARDSGTFNYSWGLGDERSDALRVWDEDLVWTETVKPASQ